MDEFTASYSLVTESGDTPSPPVTQMNGEPDQECDSKGDDYLAPLTTRLPKNSILKKRATPSASAGRRNDESEVTRDAMVTFSEPHSGELSMLPI